MFFPISGRHVGAMYMGTNMASHTNLYKFVWNIMSNNSSMEYRTDLRLGQSTYLYIVYSV